VVVVEKVALAWRFEALFVAEPSRQEALVWQQHVVPWALAWLQKQAVQHGVPLVRAQLAW
jgi:hypothetical protein